MNKNQKESIQNGNLITLFTNATTEFNCSVYKKEVESLINVIFEVSLLLIT